MMNSEVRVIRVISLHSILYNIFLYYALYEKYTRTIRTFNVKSRYLCLFCSTDRPNLYKDVYIYLY